jgi:hypothetical protein
MKYYFLALFEAIVLVYVLPLVVGFFAGLIKREQAVKRVWHIAGAMVALLNVAVMIEKGGVPFLTGHLIGMFSSVPFTLSQQLMVGLVGDAVLLFAYWRFVGRGVRSGVRFVTREPTA